VVSEWTVNTLKEHLTALLDAYKDRVSDTFVERDKAITEFKAQADQKFASRNEIQTAMKDAAEASERAMAKLTSSFITRQEALALVLAACTITGTIIMVINFFMRK